MKKKDKSLEELIAGLYRRINLELTTQQDCGEDILLLLISDAIQEAYEMGKEDCYEWYINEKFSSENY